MSIIRSLGPPLQGWKHGMLGLAGEWRVVASTVIISGIAYFLRCERSESVE